MQLSSPQPLDPADLARAQPMKPGEPLRATDVSHAIDGLFATGRFEDIAVEVEPASDGVRVRFVTKNATFIGGVSLVVDPILWTEKRPFLRWWAALKIEESQCPKPARVTHPA